MLIPAASKEIIAHSHQLLEQLVRKKLKRVPGYQFPVLAFSYWPPDPDHAKTREMMQNLRDEIDIVLRRNNLVFSRRAVSLFGIRDVKLVKRGGIGGTFHKLDHINIALFVEYQSPLVSEWNARKRDEIHALLTKHFGRKGRGPGIGLKFFEHTDPVRVIDYSVNHGVRFVAAPHPMAVACETFVQVERECERLAKMIRVVY